MPNRPYNFSAGPAAIPESVLEKVQQELLNWQGTGVSMLELGHRTPEFKQLLLATEQKLRDVIAIPSNYRILFLPGGARMQFASIPMNLLGKNSKADYIVSGHWSEVAFTEAQKYGKPHLAATSKANDYFTVPNPDNWQLSPDAAYRFYCSNETLLGVQLRDFPVHDKVPLVADMTSDFLSRPLNIKDFGLVFASTQKTMGTSGLCVVIVRDDLLDQKQALTPTVVDFAVQAKEHSLYNTPNVFAIYVLGLMLDWLAEQGGVKAIAEVNQRKADKLYQLIDTSDFYINHVAKPYRSVMNVSFNLPSEALSESFLQQAEEHGLMNLRGHSVVGGARASLYNPMPEAALDKLAAFMRDFEQQH